LITVCIIKLLKMKSKETLEAQVSGLETKIQELTNELSTAQYDLRVIGKPTMTENVYQLLIGTIRDAVMGISFSEGDFDYDLTMQYDNRVELECLSFNEHDAMSDDIIRCIDNEFRVIENEENPTTDES
jgi:CTP:phosphocholine cytidylyltransferase-like protein